MIKAREKLPTVAIFGRVNVGKSTLFNRLTETKQALASKIEGTTRDGNIGVVSWRGKSFELVDTGGIIDLKYLAGKKRKTEDIEEQVQARSRQILERADFILFVVDALDGPLPQDKQMALFLKKTISGRDFAVGKTKIVLVANKADNPKIRKEVAEFHKLSLGEPVPVSAANGSGTGDLLDLIIKNLKFEKKKAGADKEKKKTNPPGGAGEKEKREGGEVVKAAIVGRPNVGKSSLLNSILGEERIIVSPIPHTTREPQNTEMEYKRKRIVLVDTAGISKKGAQAAYKKKEKETSLEKMGIAKSIAALGKADVALLVVEINKPITRQDLRVAEEIIKRKKSLIIIANKWDLVKDKNTKKYTEYLRSEFPFAAWAPVQFVSALTGAKVKKIMDLILDIGEQRKKKISDSSLNSFLMRAVKKHRPAKGKGLKHPRIHGFKQVEADPPVFELRIGAKDDLHFSYVRFIENRLREKFGFSGTPITIYVAKNKAVHGKREK